VGTLMAELVDAVGRGHDHDATPVRVTLPRTGHALSLGAYSRRRRVAEGAPRSVMG
jgi:hypothetical protein